MVGILAKSPITESWYMFRLGVYGELFEGAHPPVALPNLNRRGIYDGVGDFAYRSGAIANKRI